MNFKSTITSLSLIAASGLFTLAHAQTAMPGMSAMPAASAAMPMSAVAMTDGEDRKSVV